MSAETRGGPAPAGRPSSASPQHEAPTTAKRTGPVQERPTTAWIARLRWRGPWWHESSSTRARIYARREDAYRAAERLKAEGYQVEVSIARRTPWHEVEAAPWTTTEYGRRLYEVVQAARWTR